MTRRSLFALAFAKPSLKITKLELIPVRVTERTVWLFVRLTTDKKFTGLGEASDAFGFAGTTKPMRRRWKPNSPNSSSSSKADRPSKSNATGSWVSRAPDLADSSRRWRGPKE